MCEKKNAGRVAWVSIKLSEIGQKPVTVARLAAQVGLAPEETVRLLRLVWWERVAVRDGVVHLDATPEGPRRYEVDAGGQAVGSGKGCCVDMYLLALAPGKPVYARASCLTSGIPITVDITPERVVRIDPPTAVVAVTTFDVDLTGGPDRTDAEIGSHQPFFATAEAAADWLATHRLGRRTPMRDCHAEACQLVEWLERRPAPRV